MSDESQQERQLRKAREGLAHALASVEPDQAAHNLLLLPPGPERDEALPRVAGLVRREIAIGFGKQQWDRLAFFAARAAREPGLLSAGAAEGEAERAHWALLWGAIKTKAWPRAEHHRLALAPILPQALSRGIEVVVASQGSPLPGRFELIPEPPAPDPRLGYDTRRDHPAVPPAAPCAVEEAEARVLELFADSSWASFAEQIEEWIRGAPADVARAVRVAACHLAVGALLRAEGDAAWGPARAVARHATTLGAPPELEADVRVGLARVAAALPRDIHDPTAFGALDALIRAALGYPALARVSGGHVMRLRFGTELRTGVMELLGAIDSRTPAPDLALKAFRLAALEPKERKLPGWSESALERELGRPEELRAALARLTAEERGMALAAAANLLPPPLVERLVDSLWDGADEEIRSGLASVLDSLLERLSASPLSSAAMERLIRTLVKEDGDLDPGALRRRMRAPGALEELEQMGMLDDVDSLHNLTAEAASIFRRQAERLIPRGRHFLEAAMELAETPEERRRAARVYWDSHPGVPARLRLLVEMGPRASDPAVAAVHQHALAAHAGDGPFLVKALTSALHHGLGRTWIGQLSAALVEAADAKLWQPTADEKHAVIYARHHLASRRTSKRRAPAARRPAFGQGMAVVAEWTPGSPFDPDSCLARFEQDLISRKYSSKTASVYGSSIRRLFRWLEEKGRLREIRTRQEMVDGMNEFLRELHGDGRRGQAVATACRSFMTYLAHSRELE